MLRIKNVVDKEKGCNAYLSVLIVHELAILPHKVAMQSRLLMSPALSKSPLLFGMFPVHLCFCCCCYFLVLSV